MSKNIKLNINVLKTQGKTKQEIRDAWVVGGFDELYLENIENTTASW